MPILQAWKPTPAETFSNAVFRAHRQPCPCRYCDEVRCARELGVTYADARARHDTFAPWVTAVRSHQWSCGPATCLNCHQTGTCITAANQSLCIRETCLGQSRVWWWPTGDWRPNTYLLLDHLLDCTLH